MKLGRRSTTLAGVVGSGAALMQDLTGVCTGFSGFVVFLGSQVLGGGVVPVLKWAASRRFGMGMGVGFASSGSSGRKPAAKADSLNRSSVMSPSLYTETKALSLMTDVKGSASLCWGVADLEKEC